MDVFLLILFSCLLRAAPITFTKPELASDKSRSALAIILLRSRAVSPLFGRRVSRIALSEGVGQNERAERLKLKAEEAALQAQIADLEARKLELQAMLLKGKHEESVASEEVSGLNSPLDVSVPVSAAPWPEPNGIRHRIIEAEMNDSALLGYKTRMNFLSSREPGGYNGSFRVRFTLPGEDDQLKTVDFLESCKGGSGFGAVKLKTSGLLECLTYGQKRNELNTSQKVLTVTNNEQDELVTGQLGVFSTILDLFNLKEPASVRDDLKRAELNEIASELKLETDVGGLRPGDIIRGWSTVKKFRSLVESERWFIPEPFRSRLRAIREQCVLGNRLCFFTSAEDDEEEPFEFTLNAVLAEEGEEIILLVERPS